MIDILSRSSPLSPIWIPHSLPSRLRLLILLRAESFHLFRRIMRAWADRAPLLLFVPPSLHSSRIGGALSRSLRFSIHLGLPDPVEFEFRRSSTTTPLTLPSGVINFSQKPRSGEISLGFVGIFVSFGSSALVFAVSNAFFELSPIFNLFELRGGLQPNAISQCGFRPARVFRRMSMFESFRPWVVSG